MSFTQRWLWMYQKVRHSMCPDEDNDYFQIIHIADENHLVRKVVRL
ncbi:hypothetical protein O9993_01305 [Vibrio lentus]|nr:hypothetical protein [Vibrio lentus]